MAERVKVFYFIPNLQQGGAERQMLAMIRNLPPRFEPVLCLYHDEVHYQRELPPGQPRHVLGVRSMSARPLARLVEIMRQERPQIVHCYRDKANFWGRLAALMARVPVIISSCRARMIQPRYIAVERVLSELCQQVTVNSIGTKRELITLAGVRPERIRVIHNFLDHDHFHPPTAAQRREARERWQLSEAQRVMLLAGRISLQKHQLGAVLALDDLARAGQLPEQPLLLLAGRERDLRMVAAVRRVTRRRRLQPIVRELDAQRDIRSLYWAADMLLLPSLWEGLPNAALEASACGLPVLISQAANLDGIVVDGVTGYQVPTADRAALAEALRLMLHAPRDSLQRMGARGSARMRERFSAERVRAELVDTYDTLLAAAATAR